MNNDIYTKLYKPKELSQLLGITNESLRKWNQEGKIKSITTEGGHRRYIYQNMEKSEGKYIIYARVSSRKQANDLQRQIDFIKEKFPNYEIISDIGSGINFKRKGLISLLEQLFAGNVKEVVVAYKDRLCRFGFELFEFMFQKHGAILTVLEDSSSKEPIKEFAEDVLSIITVFTARFYGKRKYNILQKNKNLSNKGTNKSIQQMYRGKPIFLQPGKPLYKNRVPKKLGESKD